jgi:hypothetical protein
MWVVEFGKGDSFFAELFAGRLVRQCARRQNFDGHFAVQVLVLGAVHFAHPTSADPFEDVVVA